MSLSDEERISGLYYSIHRLSELRQRLLVAKRKNDGYPYPGKDHFLDLETKLDGLWHCLLACQSNSLHWILGSDSGRLIQSDDKSPWAIAVLGNVPSLEFDWKMGTPVEWLPEDPLADLTGEKEFFDPFYNGFLTIPALLRSVRHEGEFFALAFEIYQEIETLIYYLRRYRDGLLERFGELNKHISAMQGSCFSIFRDEAFAKAYVLHNVCKLLYGNINPFCTDKNDVVTRWAVKQCVHHDIPAAINEWTLKEIAELHLHIVHHKESLVERMIGLMRLAGGRYQYDHEYKELCAMIKDESAFRKAKSRIKAQFEACKKAHEQSEKKDRERDTPFTELQAGIYGFCQEQE